MRGDQDDRGGGNAPSRARTDTEPRVLASLRAVAVGLVRLVVPVVCPGCGRWDEVLCPGCRALVGGRVRRVEAGAGRLDLLGTGPSFPVWARARYDGPVREVVLAWKDHGRIDLTEALADVLAGTAQAVAAVLAELAEAADRAEGRPAQGDARRRPVVVVPVPSSSGATRRRGEDLVARLADRVGREMTAHGARAVVSRALVRRRGGSDQAGLGARARGHNVSGRVRVARRARRSAVLAGATVLLVDDVVTTGATLRGCVRALEQAGACVVGAVVLAATPPPDRRQEDQRHSSGRPSHGG